MTTPSTERSTMQVQWYGQSAFRLTDGDTTVFIDPFGDMSALAKTRGLQFDYPPITGVSADLVLVTHEHGDHNNVEVIDGSPAVIRATAGRHESPVGEVLRVASEHDANAGTERGPNTIVVFELGGVRVAHFGDFGQSELRAEQADAIGSVDLLFIPVWGGPTIVRDLGGLSRLSWVVTAYLLALTVVTPLYGKLGDLYGRKIVLQAALVLFLIGSALCGLAQGMTELIVFRAIQGLGGGGLMVSAQAAIRDVVAPSQRCRYSVLFGPGFRLSSSAVPRLGGFLTSPVSGPAAYY